MISDEQRSENPEPPAQGKGGVWDAIFGPSLRGIAEAMAASHARRAAAFSGFGWFLRLLLLGPDPEEDEDAEVSRASLLMAAVLLGLVGYTWPVVDIVPFWITIPVGLVVLFSFYRTVQLMSVRGSGSRWEHWLRVAQSRIGVVGAERFGFLLGVAGCVGAVALKPGLLPLTLGVTGGFFKLMTCPFEYRSLRTVRQFPPPLPTDDGDEHDWANDPDYVAREFNWSVEHVLGTNTHKLVLYLHEPTYAQLRAENPGGPDYSENPYIKYVVDGTTPCIERAGRELAKLSQERRYSTYEEVSLALAFAQSIEYSFDIDSIGQREYWRNPIETLVDQTGDCEDSTILTLALLRQLRHRVVGLLSPSHAALGVEVPSDTEGHYLQYEGRRYYFCETTETGWKVGELPRTLEDDDAEIFPIPTVG